MPADEFVDRAYQAVLGRDADPEGRIHHLTALNGSLSRAEMITAFLASDEFTMANRDVKIIGLPQVDEAGQANRGPSGWRAWFRRS